MSAATTTAGAPDVRDLIARALAEDLPFGDVSGDAFVPAEQHSTAHLRARVPGVAAGLEVFADVMRHDAPGVDVDLHIQDGQSFDANQVLATVRGPSRALLARERVALNFVQRLSAIASGARELSELVAGTRTRVVDTRKTTPGLRALEKYAVRAGGGHNHRYSLSDAIMLKDNHLEAIFERYRDGDGTVDLDAAAAHVRELRRTVAHTLHLEIEVDRPALLDFALAAGADSIMLDNFSLEQTREAVAHIAGRALIEASGNVTRERIRDIAATGVDIISVGALTHSVRALDLGLDFVPATDTPGIDGLQSRTGSGRPGARAVPAP